MTQESIAKRWALDRLSALDRALWEAGCRPGDPFDDLGHGATLRSASIQKYQKGYRHWLNYLDSQGWLLETTPPLARVTRRRLLAYYRAMRAANNADYTIIGRFAELTGALKILCPGSDVSWIARPNGATIYSQLLKPKRHLVVPNTKILYDWGVKMMTTAASQPTPLGKLLAFRDGLMIAMFAGRARRLRSMSLLRIGHELIREGPVYRLELTRSQVKTGKTDSIAFPEHLTPYIDTYLQKTRPMLLCPAVLDNLWIGARGRALTEKEIQSRFFDLTRQRFGMGFGPHRCRHPVATTSALKASRHPGMAPTLLGISAEVLEQSYNRAGQVEAAIAYAKLVEERRGVN
jgi:hypothetical protein